MTAVRRRSLLAALVAVLLAVSCASASSSGGGFALSAAQLSQDAAPPADPESDWAVQVATAKPEVPVVTAFASPPPELGIDDPPPDATTLPGANLSPIPGPTPNVSSSTVLGGWSFNNPTYFDNPLVFLWIKAAEVDVTTHEWHAEINVTTNTLKVWDGDELRAETQVVDGKPSSPTPLGRFYFNEKIQRTPTSAYGSWIISTNAYSDSLEVFDDGLPVFAVHGTNNPAQVGSDISNGCVRVPNEIIEMMATEMPMGSPIDVVA
jgi:hypothetical protein